MAKYTTVSNMMILMPDVQSRTNANSAQLAHFIEMAEGRVDAYLAKRYQLPLSIPAPHLIETISTHLSVYEFLSKRVFAGQVAAESFWVAAYKESIRDLENIVKGRMELVDSGGALTISEASEIWSSTQDYLPTFTEDSQLNQSRDPDKIEDIRRDREFYWAPL